MIHLLEAVASREVISNTNRIELPSEFGSQIRTEVDIERVDRILDKNDFGITFPEEIKDLIKEQNTEVIQIHVRISQNNF